MPSIKIPVKYYRIGTDSGIECNEDKFEYVHRTLTLGVDETAVVIVDPWNTHYILSWLERATEITRTKIAPILRTARRCGMKVIYAPSPEVARKHPQWTRFADEEDDRSIDRCSFHVSGKIDTTDDWPPLEFKERTGKYAKYSRSFATEPHFRKWDKEVGYSTDQRRFDISDVVWPLPEDFVVANGNQLHRLLKFYGILHLFYCGFAANACVPGRDYGMRAFHGRGYNLVLIEDATTGIESHDTMAGLLATKIAIREIEMFLGFSTSTDNFLRSCSSAV